MPFAVRGGQQYGYLGEGMIDLLSSKLRSSELRSVNPHVLLSFEGLVATPNPDPGVARTIASRFGAELLVLGNVLEAGDRLHLEATLYRTEPRLAVLTVATAEGPASELFALVDHLARQLLSGLTGGPAARLTRLAVTTTDSFAALKSYLEGETEMRAMRRAPAAEAYRRAVESDPSFALAWYRLAVAALWSGQLELARDAVDRALPLSERLSEHDRMLVRAFAAFLRGQAERLYLTITGNSPGDLEAWYQLGEVLFHYRPLRGGSIQQSRAAWERVLELEPDHVSALVHLAVIAACEERHAEVDALIRRALAISPESDTATWLLTLQAWESGDRRAQETVTRRLLKSSDFAVARSAWFVALPSRELEGARATARLLTEPSRSAEVRAVGYLWLAHLELVRGSRRAAQDHLVQVGRIHSASYEIYATLLALPPFLSREDSQLEEARDRLARWDAEAVPRCLIAGAYFTVHNDMYSQLKAYLEGVIAARLGDRETAEDRASALEAISARPEAEDLARDQARSIRAHILWREGRASAALAVLERTCMGALFELTIASPFFSQAYERYLRAELLNSLGRAEEALAWYGSFAGHSIYDLIYSPPSHLRRAEIHAGRQS